MTDLRISAELAEWAGQAGFSVTAEDAGASACFWNAGGEERYYLRRDPEDSDWIVVTNISRSSDEQFVFAAQGLQATERYFWGFFGTAIRSRSGLPRLRVPVRAEEVADGYAIDGRLDGHTHLTDPNHLTIMRARDDVSDVALLVKTSHWLAAKLPELTETYLDPAGRPLFPL
jgi:hypothetical protein